MNSAWDIGELTWKELGRRTWAEIREDEVFGRAAQLSYYFLLALFPLLLFLIALLGYFASAAAELRHNLAQSLASMLPASAAALVQTTLDEIVAGSDGGKLSLGLLAALWAASHGMGAIVVALNIAYDVPESRRWWQARLVAIALTVALAILIISALALILYGDRIVDLIAEEFGVGSAFALVWKLLHGPIALAFVFLAFALIYNFAPNLRARRRHWITPGSVLGVSLWLLVSFAFRLYLQFFDSYTKTYGSLGAVIVLMLWFYLTSAAILIGGELNSEIESAQRKSQGPVRRAEKKPPRISRISRT